MELFYTFFISFFLIFLSELGDKTQLLVLSFSTTDKSKNILLGVAIGTLLSHGIAILFGSKVASLGNADFQLYLQFFTYFSFLLFGILGFCKKDKNNSFDEANHISKLGFLQKIAHFPLFRSCTFIVALSIIVGELGDKTFLASLGLGIQYPTSKISLILGSIVGMVFSNSLALFFGKFISHKFNPKYVQILSNVLFILFGIFGFVSLLFS